MKTLKILSGVIVSLVLILIGIYAFYGGFTNVKCTIAEQGGETLVYKEIKGDYSQSGDVMNKMYYALINDNKIETFKGFGIYYDNPQKVEKSKLRSEVGCILEPVDTVKVFWLKGKYSIKVCPIKKYIVTEFPHKGNMSIMVSIMKVYPALNKYMEENGYEQNVPVMEIYDMPNKKILYRAEVIKISK